MRLLVLRLLLLAVFFNTAIGMPLHGATHIRQAAAGPAQAFVGLNGCEDDALTGQAGQRGQAGEKAEVVEAAEADRKSTRLNSSHVRISYAVFCLKKKKKTTIQRTTEPPTLGPGRGGARTSVEP